MNKFGKYFIFLIGVFLLGFSLVSAEVSSSTGIIPGAIWYSKEPLIVEETVKIYTAIWNGQKENLVAKVEFYDKNVVLGTKDITVLPEQIKEASISWKVTSGDHILSAKIISSSINKENIILEKGETEKKRVFVPVLIKNEEGTTTTSSGAIKNQLGKTTSEIENILPESVSSKFSEIFSEVDNFRNDFLDKVIVSKEKAEREIEILNQDTENSSNNNGVKKPVTQVKLFSLVILSFILGHKILFYIISLFVAFLVIRFVFRLIANK